MPLPNEILNQITDIQPNPARPLLICDADEVLLQFAVTLEIFLQDQGYQVRFDTFNLFGNVRDAQSGKVVDNQTVGLLIDQFFQDRVRDCPPVPGAVKALNRLSSKADIIILSNLPITARQARLESMRLHGMDYPLIANVGAKGPAVRALLQNHQAPAMFVDDLPPHHASVAKEVPHVHRLHFVADRRLAALIDPAPQAHTRIDCWDEAADYLEPLLAHSPANAG